MQSGDHYHTKSQNTHHLQKFPCVCPLCVCVARTLTMRSTLLKLWVYDSLLTVGPSAHSRSLELIHLAIIMVFCSESVAVLGSIKYYLK